MYQTNPPLEAKKTLPTMYDLPSEYPEDEGLPDKYHLLQSRILEDTFQPTNYPPDQVFVATDLNLYYDVRHHLWHKRPDWFAVVGVDKLYEQRDLRLSYVVWQEGVNPFVVVELLSPGTEKEDLGETLREVNKPPTKWEVYERILRIPYYVVFSGYTNQLRIFRLQGNSYEELNLTQSRFWMEDVQLGLGVWQGNYQGVERAWLRWYDANGNWILLPEEKAEQEKQRAELEKQRAEQEKQRAEQEKQRADKLAAKLRALGVDLELDNE